MKLTYDQIKEITLGALYVTQNEDGKISFSRFTDKQLEHYRIHDAGHYMRSASATGMKFSFHTDAREIRIDCEMIRATAESRFDLDILCDGAMYHHTEMTAESDIFEGVISTALPEGAHHVTVFLPSFSAFNLKSLELEGASFMTAHKPSGKKILFLGDSITHGSSSRYPSLCYTARLAAMTDAITLNQGIGGDIFRPGIIDPELPFDPDVVTIAFGTNDWSGARENPALRLSRASAYFDNVKNAFPKAKIVYISPIWRRLTDAEYATFLPARLEFEALAKEKGLALVDGFTLVPHLCEFYSDGLHPNPLGFSLYAENLAVALKKLGVI